MGYGRDWGGLFGILDVAFVSLNHWHEIGVRALEEEMTDDGMENLYSVQDCVLERRPPSSIWEPSL